MVKLYSLAFVSVVAVIALVWYFFIVPLGRQDHERRLEMIRRKIEKREGRLGEDLSSGASDADDSGTD